MEFELTNQDSAGGKNFYMKHFASPSFQFGVKSYLLVVRQVSPGRVMVVWIWIKYAVPPQIKRGILKLIVRRDQSKLSLALKKKAIIVSVRLDS